MKSLIFTAFSAVLLMSASISHGMGAYPSQLPLFDFTTGTQTTTQVQQPNSAPNQLQMQQFLFQQQMAQQSQSFQTLTNAQKAMNDAIMSMLNNAK